ncbi:MAG TPA: flagellar hook capping FlgD N-terminal domain-containing protein [Vitreimonas sp.]|uniref:flagellar hook capping FlgD N-terminal domain-containing protein n=1 Tax=Vitreimonas sp. TaxID=3069702 RepID=UPI002D5DA48C|nr:flagellar hook capping FlgD N-terminal domain-containing protein [Vitreimonas sp.]HYD85993.1 flagellar hook capping FlgD N-terminal domain-containing protein [Vitreimonas sp.]
MAEIDSIAAVRALGDPPDGAGSTATSAADAFGMNFEDLLQIVLTQLTYQDPLKPMENFEFVSQLAQFSQIQQTQTMSERILGLLQAQAANQATGVLGRIVDIPAGSATISGRVQAISFLTGDPRLTIETSDGRTISGVALSSVTRIAVED